MNVFKNLFAKVTARQEAGNQQTPKAKDPVTDRIAVVSIADQFSTYPSKGLTPEKLATLLREADGGDIFRQMELFEEMLEKDGKLQTLFQTRRLAVSSRNYSIVPASEKSEDLKIAAAVDKMFKNIRGWKNSVNNILDCVPKGFSVNENYWNPVDGKYIIEKLEWVHQKMFRFGKVGDLRADPNELRLVVNPLNIDMLPPDISESERARASIDGISLHSDPRIRRRFVIAYCKARSGHPARTSLLRTLTYLFLFKNYDVKWWVKFAEVQLGYRIGKYDPNDDEQKDLLITALRGLASDSVAIISKDSEIEFKEMLQKASSHQIYKELKDWCNEEMTTVVLGHTGTSQSTPGKLGSEDTAKEVKQELVEADAQVLDETITDNIIRPFVDYNFGPQEEYPYYQTEIGDEENLLETADLVLKYQDMGGKVSSKWAKEKFGIPPPEGEGDEALQPPPSSNPFIAGAISESKKKLLTKL